VQFRPGSRFGPYEVIAAIGAGGMGEVYRARDTRLRRDVALKILPSLFAGDPERLARFEREAHTLAALNHPHIAQIHGFEQNAASPDSGEPVSALVLELVEGEDLAERLTRGPLPLDEALSIATELADALGAAHDQGIIHRDLKPANIKLRPDGSIKVLDFGLAKALDPTTGDATPGSASLSPTITAATRVGVILGTAAYMSPEQARGKRVDKRSDIWAFGCVLFEMLTGRRAFEPSTISGRATSGADDDDGVTDVLAAIITKEPEWTALPATTPASLRTLLRRCLERTGGTASPISQTRDLNSRPHERKDRRPHPPLEHTVKSGAMAKSAGSPQHWRWQQPLRSVAHPTCAGLQRVR
jgi:serine/threonine protein kinase